jgi:hypothetical protein
VAGSHASGTAGASARITKSIKVGSAELYALIGAVGPALTMVPSGRISFSGRNVPSLASPSGSNA